MIFNICLVYTSLRYPASRTRTWISQVGIYQENTMLILFKFKLGCIQVRSLACPLVYQTQASGAFKFSLRCQCLPITVSCAHAHVSACLTLHPPFPFKFPLPGPHHNGPHPPTPPPR